MRGFNRFRTGFDEFELRRGTRVQKRPHGIEIKSRFDELSLEVVPPEVQVTASTLPLPVPSDSASLARLRLQEDLYSKVGSAPINLHFGLSVSGGKP